MKFIPLSKSESPIEQPILKAEYKSAPKAGEGRMGELHFFYRYFINIKFISYENIKKAYLRIESGESGEFLLKEFYLVLQFSDDTERKLRFEREENVRSVLAYLEGHACKIEIGYKKPSGNTAQ